ncbi:MAG TPA: DNA ligase D [Terracidiphilus sp.]|jgi:bifunctional non-homologous end joining protein LigD|nr:DNA ligase D [Terracidiphilus sp.]
MPARTTTRFEAAKAVDRQLARYREIRDFQITAEPRGSASSRTVKSADALPFVVQKHAARQLHYDFRLGWRGVLKSWAVAKGPSYVTGDKRLAVEVEDHPMEYGGFEGTIPKGQYGGGTVMVWDFGEWQPLGDVDRQLADGNLKFMLNGTKLHGKWALVRMRHNPERDRSDKPNWLLLKERDEYAQPEDSPAITELAPDSALTQQTMEQIAESSDHVWEPKRGLREPESKQDPSRAQRAKSETQKLKSLDRLLRGAPLEDFPGFIPPQLAEEARSAPSGEKWVHELKLDGYRTQVHVRNSQGGSKVPKTRIYTRKGLDWTARMPGLARAAADLGVESAILDGEVVALDHTGRTSFSDLQAAFQNGKQADLIYFAFDLLHLNGYNLRGLPLVKRKEILEKLLARPDGNSDLRFCEHLQANGNLVFRKACELGAEGIVSKLVSAPYTSGRGNAWLKMKGTMKQEFVIGGFTPVAKTGHGIGALLLGYYDGGRLLYAGRCGTGFSHSVERALRIRLDALVQKTPSFATLPREARDNAIWVKPELVAQIAFAAWTKDNLIRQSSFQGLRDDKPAIDVIRESPVLGEKPSSPVTLSRKRGAATQDDAPTDPARRTTLAITRPNKILDETSGMTKQQLAEYYVAVAEHMLPQVADRPLSILRCPDGVGKQAFFQKHISAGLPNGVRTVSIANKKTGKREEFLTLDSADGLVGMAQLGVLEIHPWGSKNDAVDKPDRIIFDLDPDEAVAWDVLAAAARDLRSRLNQLKLTSYVKSTGGKGLHVVVPIEPEHEWPAIKQFSHATVLKMEKDDPSLYTTNMVKAVRKNRIYLDYLRNDREATAIAPFSTRARPGVPVAVPLDWKELQLAVRPAFHVTDFSDWQKRLRRDPWAGMIQSRQRITNEILLASGMKSGNRS